MDQYTTTISVERWQLITLMVTNLILKIQTLNIQIQNLIPLSTWAQPTRLLLKSTMLGMYCTIWV